MKTYTYIILAIVLGISSCTEPYEFEFENSQAKLVVDAVFTNLDEENTNYVHLTKSANKPLPSANNNGPLAESVTDAIVTISDNQGNSETLTYIEAEDFDLYHPNGYYKFENMRAEIGKTYTLNIQWNNQTYISTATCKAVPEISNVTFRDKFLESKNETVSIPLLHFTNPTNANNYYLLHYEVNGFAGSNRNWAYSIIDAQYLSSQVTGLELDDGQSGTGKDFYHEVFEGDEVRVFMQSLTKESYDFYDALIRQFNSDGGAFNQTPSTPPSNISNGALGLFRCSAVSTRTVIR